jgi:hypothetical protein
MGVMRFLVHPPDRLSREDAQQAYLAAADQTPWRCRVHSSPETLLVERSVSDSGNLHIPWHVEGQGKLYLSTATLMERPKPYHLAIELARGGVNQARGQLAEWVAVGMKVPEEIRRRLHDAVECFSQAVTAQNDPPSATPRADRALQLALEVTRMLVASYAEQALEARRQIADDARRLLAARLDDAPLDTDTANRVRASFNAAVAPLTWREIEGKEQTYRWDDSDEQIDWCREQGVQVVAGPLLRLDDQALPDWLYLWEGNFDHIMTFAGQFVEQAVQRYRGSVDLWQCAARINLGHALSMSEEDRLRLAVIVVQTIRRIDPQTPAVLFFDQPWAEYMARQETVLSPFDFADAMVRAGLGLTGLGLELNLGYSPGGMLPRSPLALNRLLDHWSLLGLPLYVSLTAPSSADVDPQSRGAARVLPEVAAGGWTERAQQAMAERYVPLLLSKPAVQGVFWNALRDRVPHEWPHSGLIAPDGRPKPALDTLAALRRENLA